MRIIFALRRSQFLACIFCLTLFTGHAAASEVSKPEVTQATPAALAHSSFKPAPKLVVLLVIDGLPQRQVLAYRDQLQPDGLARFLERGSWFANANHDHAFTVTAVGHASLLTGAYPRQTGIIGNEWRNPDTGVPVYCTEDSSATYIGHATNAFDGTSPKNLKAETLGDVLRRINPAAKVIAVSGKDRGAILLAGQAGTAYMYMGGSGQFASTTHYMAKHPEWVNAFNAAKPADRYFKTLWNALLPEAAYERSLPDSQPWFGPKGGKLPMMMGAAEDDAPGPVFYSSLLRSPFADALTFDFARAAIAGEQLGQRSSNDILAISLSGHDYVNHLYSAESRLSHDHLLHLDVQLQAFFKYLDAAVGKDNYVAALTSDHGFMPSPEASLEGSSEGGALPSGRLNTRQVLGRINAGLEQKFGPGKWVVGFSGASLLLDKALIAQKAAEGKPSDAQRVAYDVTNDVMYAARNLLRAEPGIEAAYSFGELEGHLMPVGGEPPFLKVMRKSWHPEVSGQVQFVLKPNWMFGSTVATHGSPHLYDTHVPLMLYGPRWIQPGRINGDQSTSGTANIVDLAPTLAKLMGIAAPAASVGKLLPLLAP